MTYIDIHTHNPNQIQDDTISVFNCYAADSNCVNTSLLCSIGLHPWYIDENYENDLKAIFNFATHDNVVAIGETGLDKLIKVNYELQRKIFISHAQLAADISKPLIIHAVRSIHEILFLRKHFKSSPPWIIHGFRGNLKSMSELLNNGFILSFGVALLNNKIQLEDVFKSCPLDSLFLETDNSNVSIKTLYKKASELRNQSEEGLSSIILTNFNNTFLKNKI
ncbi:MAG: TatD family hydrolase [Bacteroidales bacterium]|nr:TatD family hydrolase [Bacteroidales bacterium]